MKLEKYSILSLLLFTATLGSPMQAQEKPNMALPQPGVAPAYALSRIPAGGQSRFYGVAHYGNRLNQDIQMHFYEWPEADAKPVPQGMRRKGSDKNYRVDFFVGSARPKAHFRLAQSVDISSMNFDNGLDLFDKVEFNATWLMPKYRKIPLLRLTCNCTGKYVGYFAVEILFAFDKGWFKQPDLEFFLQYGDHDRTDEFIFSAADDNGTTAIENVFTSGGVSSIDTYTWNGRKFILTDSIVSDQ